MTEGSFEAWLEAKYSRRDDSFYEKRIGEYHASMASNCVRRNYLDYTVGSEPGSDAWPHFEMGNMIEYKKVLALEEEFGDRFVKNSIPIRIDLGNFEIVGETDPVVVDWNFEIRRLYEIKKTNGMSYVRDDPKPEHVDQVHSYMKALGLNSCVINYVNPSQIDDEEFHIVEFNEDRWNEIVMRFSRLHRALTTDEMPAPADDDGQDYFCPHDDTDACCKNTEADR